MVEFPAASAARITAAFLGSTGADGAPGCAPWNEAMVADAVGELCNMIVGGWKKRLGQLAWCADLSLPSISIGRSCPPRGTLQPGTTTVTRAYAFDDSPFVVHITILFG